MFPFWQNKKKGNKDAPAPSSTPTSSPVDEPVEDSQNNAEGSVGETVREGAGFFTESVSEALSDAKEAVENAADDVVDFVTPDEDSDEGDHDDTLEDSEDTPEELDEEEGTEGENVAPEEEDFSEEPEELERDDSEEEDVDSEELEGGSETEEVSEPEDDVDKVPEDDTKYVFPGEDLVPNNDSEGEPEDGIEREFDEAEELGEAFADNLDDEDGLLMDEEDSEESKDAEEFFGDDEDDEDCDDTDDTEDVEEFDGEELNHVYTSESSPEDDGGFVDAFSAALADTEENEAPEDSEAEDSEAEAEGSDDTEPEDSEDNTLENNEDTEVVSAEEAPLEIVEPLENSEDVDPDDGNQEALPLGITVPRKADGDISPIGSVVIAAGDSPEDKKSAVSAYLENSDVYVVDMSADRDGYDLLPDSADPQFIDLPEDEEHSYLDARMIVSEASTNPGSAIMIAGADLLATKAIDLFPRGTQGYGIIVDYCREIARNANANGVSVVLTVDNDHEDLSALIGDIKG